MAALKTKLKQKYRGKRFLDTQRSNFSIVSTYGTGEVFIGVGWAGQTKALLIATPARAKAFAETILEAVKKARS